MMAFHHRTLWETTNRGSLVSEEPGERGDDGQERNEPGK